MPLTRCRRRVRAGSTAPFSSPRCSPRCSCGLSGPEGPPALDDNHPQVLRRVWRAQDFSWWMTQLLHAAAGASDVDVRRQVGEIDNVVGTRAGRTYLAEQYTRWPTRDGDLP